MRYSEQSKVEPTQLPASLSNADFFNEIAKRVNAADGEAALLLVGSSDERSLNIRRAQAALRYDLRASYFSHAALIARWNPANPGASIGLEATLQPEDFSKQVPERNGVTPFRLASYMDQQRHPNLALITLRLRGVPVLDSGGATREDTSESRKAQLLTAARRPNQQRDVYPLWEAIGTWSGYSHCVHRSRNPLLENVPLPAAAYCAYAYAAAGVDIAPGAASNHVCPELLWATFLRWQKSLEQEVEQIGTYVVIRDEQGASLATLSTEIEL